MVENDESIGYGTESKFMRVLLIIVAALLLFAGPTYVPFVLSNVLSLSSIVSMVTGLVLFIVGIFLVMFLVRKEIIT